MSNLTYFGAVIHQYYCVLSVLISAVSGQLSYLPILKKSSFQIEHENLQWFITSSKYLSFRGKHGFQRVRLLLCSLGWRFKHVCKEKKIVRQGEKSLQPQGLWRNLLSPHRQLLLRNQSESSFFVLSRRFLKILCHSCNEQFNTIFC